MILLFIHPPPPPPQKKAFSPPHLQTSSVGKMKGNVLLVIINHYLRKLVEIEVLIHVSSTGQYSLSNVGSVGKGTTAAHFKAAYCTHTQRRLETFPHIQDVLIACTQYKNKVQPVTDFHERKVSHQNVDGGHCLALR